jgi:uncharacterized glyoxalase superfamily protein PhnB
MFASLLLNGQAILLGAHCSADEAAKWCGDDASMLAWAKEAAKEYEGNPPGVGMTIYLAVDDVDAYHKTLEDRGVEPMLEPTTQFYGQRDFPLRDPDGYRLTFYTPVKMESCQSCGMPMADGKAGQMYCAYCSDEQGNLKPYEVILEGTVTGYFMEMQKMERKAAEKAAKEHLGKMPAWTARS